MTVKKTLQGIWRATFGVVCFGAAYSIWTGAFPETLIESFKLSVVAVLVFVGIETACRPATDGDGSDED